MLRKTGCRLLNCCNGTLEKKTGSWHSHYTLRLRPFFIQHYWMTEERNQQRFPLLLLPQSQPERCVLQEVVKSAPARVCYSIGIE